MQPHPLPPSQALMTTAERLLGETIGRSVRLGAGELLQDGIRSLVYRFPLLDGPARTPASVIVKQVKSTQRVPYDPTRATMPAWAFFNEWASLQFLDTIALVACLDLASMVEMLREACWSWKIWDREPASSTSS
jgi:hypothetical protein